jgi:hypothetical protein
MKVCKTVGIAYVGSNPTPCHRRETGPSLGDLVHADADARVAKGAVWPAARLPNQTALHAETNSRLTRGFVTSLRFGSAVSAALQRRALSIPRHAEGASAAVVSGAVPPQLPRRTGFGVFKVKVWSSGLAPVY